MIALVLNAGSSSLKYALFELAGARERELVRGKEEVHGEGGHTRALHAALATLGASEHPAPECVGHRLVHGGPRHRAPVRVDPALLASLRDVVPLSPLHLPAELAAVEAVATALPGAPQVVCFDTAFHRTLPEVAVRFALPEQLFEGGVRRYGFHGLSYEHVVDVLGAEMLGRAVIAHLGSGASMAAVESGRSVETTMGMTPAGGMVMGTRAGDLDPGVLVYLLDHGYDTRALQQLVEREAGLRALSGGASDVKELLERRGRDPRAALALAMFVYSAKKWIGALAAVLGGLDTLVFTGGVGENAAPIRGEICAGLGHLGVTIDEAANARGADVVSTAGSRCAVRIVPADEERVIARHTRRVLGGELEPRGA